VRQDCLLCERTSPDNNLYCQEVYCPAEMSPTILDRGEWLGNIEIVKPIIVLRSSVVYEARYQKSPVLLKVAHPGPENRERLKREAALLQRIQPQKAPIAHLPRLLPPYRNAHVEQEPYGKVVLKGHLLYYCLFEHFTGEPLRDILTKNVQMWVYHIGWIMIHLTSALAVLQSKGLFHFGISPDSVLVCLDDDSSTPGVLLVDLGIASDRQGLSSHWHPFFVRPAYTAPELLNGRAPQASYATDVYGLGLTLYEMLIGEPPYTYKLLSDEQVYEAVRAGRRVDMTRSEDVRTAADIAMQAVNSDMAARFPNAVEMMKKLQDCFGDVPVAQPHLNLKLLLLVVGALLAIAVLVAVQVYRSF
jgi:serine/threonine protein kinase